MAINWKSPWVIGGIALGGVLLIVAMRGSGGGNSDTATSLVAADQTNATLAGLSTAQGTTLGVTAMNDNAAQAISANQTQGGIVAAMLSYLTNGNNNATALQMSTAQTENDIAKTAITTDATLQLAPQLASIQASSNQALATTNDNFQLQLYPMVAQNQQMLTYLSGNAAINIEGIKGNEIAVQAASQANIASTLADAAVTKQLISTGGSIITGAMGGGIGGGGGGGSSGGGGGGAASLLGGFF